MNEWRQLKLSHIPGWQAMLLALVISTYIGRYLIILYIVSSQLVQIVLGVTSLMEAVSQTVPLGHSDPSIDGCFRRKLNNCTKILTLLPNWLQYHQILVILTVVMGVTTLASSCLNLLFTSQRYHFFCDFQSVQTENRISIFFFASNHQGEPPNVTKWMQFVIIMLVVC